MSHLANFPILKKNLKICDLKKKKLIGLKYFKSNKNLKNWFISTGTFDK